jgi:serine/threonine protein phosphatase PrpC
MGRLNWSVAAVTDTGCKRSENQDNFYVSPDNRVFVVADGMGGERGGATASRLAVEAVAKLWEEEKPHATDKQRIEQWLQDAVASANSSVWHTSSKDATVHGMGTTIVMAVQTDDGHLYIAHVGDSRAYLVRDGVSKVLTQDHSVVMELLLQGKISQEQFRTSPFRNYITRCVGHNAKVDVDNTPSEVAHGDRIILCTDGLPAVLCDESIGEIAEHYDNPDDACAQLLKETLAGGAPDNVTIVVVYYSEVPAEVAEQQPEQLAGKEN